MSPLRDRLPGEPTTATCPWCHSKRIPLDGYGALVCHARDGYCFPPESFCSRCHGSGRKLPEPRRSDERTRPERDGARAAETFAAVHAAREALQKAEAEWERSYIRLQRYAAAYRHRHRAVMRRGWLRRPAVPRERGQWGECQERECQKWRTFAKWLVSGAMPCFNAPLHIDVHGGDLPCDLCDCIMQCATHRMLYHSDGREDCFRCHGRAPVGGGPLSVDGRLWAVPCKLREKKD